MQGAIAALRALHITAGVLALAVCALPLASRKGGRLHRRSGAVYAWAMFSAAVTALGVVPLRLLSTRSAAVRSRSVFLGYVAVLSFTSCFYGYRVLGQKGRREPHRALVDRAVPSALLVASGGIALYGVVTHFPLGYLFAPLGVLVATGQLRAMASVPTARNWWLIEHLRAMLVATIGTLTAFLVQNTLRVLPHAGVWPWLVPTLLGVPAMILWRRRYERVAPTP
ncbi:MAG: hypothetical protein HY909_04330 [Deltaproteobacteria bacterium]|nr:hypothetical protein [Deltaproteobacteria bacterium]